MAQFNSSQGRFRVPYHWVSTGEAQQGRAGHPPLLAGAALARVAQKDVFA
jgi:hypothetical protein